MDSVVYRRSTTAPPGDISLSPESWRILARLDGERTIAEIAQAIGIEEAKAAALAFALYQSGILEIAKGGGTPAIETVNHDFFDQVTLGLATAIGPLAEIVIDEELEKLGESREQFPRDRIADLVEGASQSIPDQARRIKFQQVMLEVIRRYQAH